MNLFGKAHGDSVAKQELFSSGGFGSTISPSLFAAASASSSSNQTSFALAATGPSATAPPLFGAASSSNISNPANFLFAVTGPSASPSPFFGAASFGNIISNPANFGLAATDASASAPPLFGAASSSNIISNPANFGLAATDASASAPPLFGAASSSNISNPASFGLAPIGESASAPPFFDAAASSNTTNPANFALVGTGPSIFRPPLFDATSSGNISNPANFGFDVGSSLFRPSLFAASSSGNSSTQALSRSAVLPPCANSFNVFPSLSAIENPSAALTYPVFCSSSNMASLPNFTPPTYNSTTVASPPVFGCGFIVNSSSDSSSVASPSTPFPAPLAPSSSIFATTTTASVLPPQELSNKQEFSFGGFGSPASPFAFTSLSSQINPPAVGFSFSKTISSPTEVLFGTTTSTMASPPVSKCGKEVGKPTPRLCPCCGQTLLSGNVYTPTLTDDQFKLEWFQSISAMPENEAKSHEELRWANHLLQGNTKNNAVPIAQSTTWSQPQQWTIPVMVLPVMPLPTWSTLPYTPASASTLPAFATNAAAFGYAPSPSFSGTAMMAGVFNLCDMFRRL